MDRGGKWNTFTLDLFGNLAQVQETALRAVYSYYSYDVLKEWITVTMPRNGVTQTRSFSYATSPGNPPDGNNPQQSGMNSQAVKQNCS